MDYSLQQAIDKNLDRLKHTTLAEVRSNSITELLAVAEQFQLVLSNEAVSTIVQVLQQAQGDEDSARSALQILLTLIQPKDDQAPTKREVSHADALLACNGFAMFTSLLRNEDLFLRLFALQLFRALLAARRSAVESLILSDPLVLAAAASMLSDSTYEALRNETLLLFLFMTETNEALQKIIAFQGVMELVLDIVISEGLLEGGIVVRDCLQLVLNLVRSNASNQKYLRETDCLPKLALLLNSPFLSSLSQDKESSWASIEMLLQLFDALLPLTQPQDSKTSSSDSSESIIAPRNSLTQAQDAFLKARITEGLLSLALVPLTPVATRTHALTLLSHAIHVHAKAQHLILHHESIFRACECIFPQNVTQLPSALTAVHLLVLMCLRHTLGDVSVVYGLLSACNHDTTPTPTQDDTQVNISPMDALRAPKSGYELDDRVSDAACGVIQALLVRNPGAQLFLAESLFPDSPQGLGRVLLQILTDTLTDTPTHTHPLTPTHTLVQRICLILQSLFLGGERVRVCVVKSVDGPADPLPSLLRLLAHTLTQPTPAHAYTHTCSLMLCMCALTYDYDRGDETPQENRVVELVLKNRDLMEQLTHLLTSPLTHTDTPTPTPIDTHTHPHNPFLIDPQTHTQTHTTPNDWADMVRNIALVWYSMLFVGSQASSKTELLHLILNHLGIDTYLDTFASFQSTLHTHIHAHTSPYHILNPLLNPIFSQEILSRLVQGVKSGIVRHFQGERMSSSRGSVENESGGEDERSEAADMNQVEAPQQAQEEEEELHRSTVRGWNGPLTRELDVIPDIADSLLPPARELATELQFCKQLIREQDLRVVKTQSTCEDLSGQLTALREEKMRWECMMQETQGKYCAMEDELKKTREDLAARNAELTAAQQEIQLLRRSRDSLTQQQQQQHTTSSFYQVGGLVTPSSPSPRVDPSVCGGELQSLRDENDALRRQCSELRGRLTELATTCAKKDATMQMLQMQIKTLRSRGDGSSPAPSPAAPDASRLKDIITNLQRHLAEEKRKNQNLEKEYNDLLTTMTNAV